MSLKETFQPIQPIQPKTDEKISIFGREVTPMYLLQDLIHISSEKGWDCWDFRVGDPEFWKFSSKLIVRGGKALDLGGGLGRTSMPFALQGMEVTVYETNPAFVRAMKAVVKNFDLPIAVLSEDVRTADFGQNIYDTVILGQTFAHFESREEALEVLDKAIDALKPGGCIWFRGNGKGDSANEGQMSNSYFNPFQEIEDTYMNTCNCSGEIKIEAHLFFDPLELARHINERGLKIVHTQMVPEPGKVNIMFGENWGTPRDQFDDSVSQADLFNEGERAYRGDDIITIIGQKN